MRRVDAELRGELLGEPFIEQARAAVGIHLEKLRANDRDDPPLLDEIEEIVPGILVERRERKLQGQWTAHRTTPATDHLRLMRFRGLTSAPDDAAQKCPRFVMTGQTASSAEPRVLLAQLVERRAEPGEPRAFLLDDRPGRAGHEAVIRELGPGLGDFALVAGNVLSDAFTLGADIALDGKHQAKITEDLHGRFPGRQLTDD